MHCSEIDLFIARLFMLLVIGGSLIFSVFSAVTGNWRNACLSLIPFTVWGWWSAILSQGDLKALEESGAE